jgi:nucleotidyltransferase substrate binding protein (TIGR01987 family)
MSQQDIRWIQRFNNFQKALAKLGEAVEQATARELNDLEKQGLIQAFEFTQDLAWKRVKNFYESQGETNIQGSRDAFRMAYNRGLIDNADIYIRTIQSRKDTSHSYNEETANAIVQAIVSEYYAAFEELERALQAEKAKEQG